MPAPMPTFVCLTYRLLFRQYLHAEMELPRRERLIRKLRMTLMGFLAAVGRSWKNSDAEGIPLLAGGVAFFIFLAIAPFITAIVMIYAWLGDDSTVGQRTEALEQVLPHEVAETINQHLTSAVADSAQTGGVALAFALGFALYCSLFAIRGFVGALNSIYHLEETRRFWPLLARQLFITVIGITLGLLALFAGAGLTFLLERSPLGGIDTTSSLIDALFWLMLLGLGGVGFVLILRVGPNRAAQPLRAILPGALFALGMCLFTSFVFSYYVANIYNYSATYGSASALVVLLMWIYLSCFSLLLGAMINRELE